MAIRDAMLPEFDHEMATTRRLLERTPEDRPDWRPHAKSTPLGQLASHVAEIPGWVTFTLERTELDMNPGNEPKTLRPIFTTRAELLDQFDRGVADARTGLATAMDDALAVNWTLKSGGHEIFTMPRSVVLRSFVLNHLIHHRAQLGVYLRMNDVPVPGSYGPSADES